MIDRRLMNMTAARPSLGPGQPLPPLREDLALIEAAPQRDGSPAWMIHDPVTNRFYRIGWLEFELLSHWHEPDAATLLAAVRADSGLDAAPEELLSLIQFLAQHHLLRSSDAGACAGLVAEHGRTRDARWRRLLHDYLFFRVPLVRPQVWLERWLPRVSFMGRRPFLLLTAAVAMIGVLLALRQWDVFLHSLQGSMSWQGLLGYAAALAVAKALHELGHAFTATWYRVRVAHMGVAFLVLWPMLYTDTSESWKLTDRRQRFRIAAAGMAVELGLAGFATLGWSLAPDGVLRDALFFLATVSWIMTLAINASPFMRFDGYFLLSDALDLPNLHQRAFAQARYALRCAILGIGHRKAGAVAGPSAAGVAAPAEAIDQDLPEAFEPALRRGLIAFAWMTWAWRLVVFIGIALAVYHFFFKALGILLFIIEIGWFLVRPVLAEISQWFVLRRQAQTGRIAASLLVVMAIVALLAVPWRGTIEAEGLLRAERQQVLYAPLPARLLAPLQPGQYRAGQTVALLDSPEIEQRVLAHRVTAEGLERQLRLSVGSVQGREQRGLIAERLQRELSALAGERAQQERLTLPAPFDGRLSDIDDSLRPGSWIAPGQPMAVLYDPHHWVVDAYVAQQDLGRVRVGAAVRFHRHREPTAPLEGTVQAIDADRQQRFAHPMLAVDHGGRLPASRGADGQLQPREARYRIRIRIDGAAADAGPAWRETAGLVRISAAPRSLLADWLSNALSVLIRESGF